MAPVIRRATPDDAQAYIDLRRALFEETSNMMFEPEEYAPNVTDEAQRIMRMNEQRHSLLAMAWHGDANVGFVAAFGNSPRRLRHSTTLVLGVRRAHWGERVGSELLAHAMDWAKHVPLRRVELTVHVTNMRAVHLYQRFGFQIEGTRRSSLLVDGAFIDEYLMSCIHEEVTPDATP